MGTIMKTDSDNYNDIADAIREKSSSSNTYLPSEMGDAIRSIPGGGGASSLDDLSDVDISSAADGQYLVYDSSTSSWINSNSTPSTAAVDVSYDNTTSALQSTNVQDAIDEVMTDLSDKMDTADPVCTGSFSMNRMAGTTEGSYSTTEGKYNEASGDASHAEGNGNVASGGASHAEGVGTVASGDYSHAQGYYANAGSAWQHAGGKYNIIDNSNVYAEIIGNGTVLHRSNARTLDWNGNEVLAGKLTLGAGPTNGEDVVRLTDLSTTIAPLFSSSSTYAVDDYVIYEGTLYKCSQAIATAGNFDPSDWTAVRIVTEISGGSGSSTLSGLSDVTITSAAAGQLLTYDVVNSKWINATPILPWVDLTGTLIAGSTTLTIQNAAITTSSVIQVFTPDGTEYDSITVTTGQVVIVFETQTNNLDVKVRVS